MCLLVTILAVGLASCSSEEQRMWEEAQRLAEERCKSREPEYYASCIEPMRERYEKGFLEYRERERVLAMSTEGASVEHEVPAPDPLEALRRSTAEERGAGCLVTGSVAATPRGEPRAWNGG